MNTTVLIVEDNVCPEGRALEQVLKDGGYTVLGIAENAEQAVSEASRHHPSVVIMDIKLGEGDRDYYAGIAAAQRVREVADTQIIYLTGLPLTDELLQKAAETQPFSFLTKPWTDSLILATVRMAILRRPHKNLCVICYAHEDARMIEELERFLQPLASEGIDIWVDSKIGKGRRWKDEISRALGMAKAAVLLVSMDFLNSRFITEVGLPELLKAQRERGLRVFPVFAGCVPEDVLRNMGLYELQGLGSPGSSISSWRRDRRDRDAWVPLHRTLKSIQGQP